MGEQLLDMQFIIGSCQGFNNFLAAGYFKIFHFITSPADFITCWIVGFQIGCTSDFASHQTNTTVLENWISALHIIYNCCNIALS